MFFKKYRIGKEHIPMTKTQEYILLNLGILCTAIGVYFFKLPNNFAIGGVTGIAVILGAISKILSASNYILILNIALLILGFLIFGKDFGLKTAYASVTMSLLIELFDFVFKLKKPLTDDPLLELVFAVMLPAVGAALLFNIHASTGGTDIIAMIFKKYSHMDIGKALFCVDIIITLFTFIIFNTKTALLCILGLAVKSILVDMTLENINMVKNFSIVTDKPDEIMEYIKITLHRGATLTVGTGVFSKAPKYIITCVCDGYEAALLKDFISKNDPRAFVTIINTSQILGKGFHHVD